MPQGLELLVVAPTLHHEVLDHPVEQAAVIAAVCHVAQEVLHGLGRLFGGQLHDDGAMVGLHLDFLTGKSQGGDQGDQ